MQWLEMGERLLPTGLQIGSLLQKRNNMIQIFSTQKKLQTLILLLLIGIPLLSNADTQVTLQWDANDPAPDGYRLYGREEGQGYDFGAFWWQGDDTFNRCTIDGLDENKTYFFVVRAFVGDDESGDSNEVRYPNGDGDSLSNNDMGAAAGGGSGSGCFIQSFFR